MKKIKIIILTVLISILCAAMIGFVACTAGAKGEKGETGDTGATGAQGAQGEQGDKGETSDAGEDGNDAMTTYELYLKYYPDYTGDEAQFYIDLANGSLSNVTYTVTFDTGGGSEVASQTIANGGKVTEPEDPTYLGHVFDGWFVEDEQWSFVGHAISGNVTLKAKWSYFNAGLEYATNADGTAYTVASYTGTDTEIILAEEIDGLPVTGIDEYAFDSNTSITSISVPASVTTFGKYAFNGCTSLATVNYAGTAQEWARLTFNGSSGNPLNCGAALYTTETTESGTQLTLLTELTLTGAAPKINTFYACTSLTKVTIGTGITSIGSFAFAYCTSLKEVTIGDSVTTISSGSFQGCTALETVEMGSKVTTLAQQAFNNCSALKSITISNGIKSIITSAFSNCSLLETVYIGSNVTSIGSSAFYNCSSVTDVYYSGTASQWAVISFNSYSANPLAASNKANLHLTDGNGGYELATSITIDTASVSSYAFYNCKSIVSVTLTSTVTSIGTSAFEYCYQMTEVINNSELSLTLAYSTNGYVSCYAYIIYTSGTSSGTFITQGEYTFYAYTPSSTTTYYLVRYSGSNTDIELPDLVVDNSTVNYSLKNYMFYNNSVITSIVIPDSVTATGNYTFVNCTNLKTVVTGDGVKTIGTGAFNGCTSLTYVVLGKSVTTINSSAFHKCSALAAVYYNGDSTAYGNITVGTSSNTYFTDATVFYYAEKDSTTEAGNYWYYDTDNSIVTWTVEASSREPATDSGSDPSMTDQE